MDEVPDEVTAYHEAGHAVLALALGRPVHQVSILPTRELLGVCEFGKAPIRPTEDWLEREALIALGGVAAEALHTGERDWEGADRDRRYVRELALDRGGNERAAGRQERRWLAKAEHLLAKPALWKAVQRIAAELLRLHEISGRAARHLFDQSRKEEE